MKSRHIGLGERFVAIWSAILLVLGLSGCTAFTNRATTSATATQKPAMPQRGDVTTFPQTAGQSSLRGLAVGPDGNLWFGESGRSGAKAAKIARFTPSGQLTEYPVPNADTIGYVIAGPDGNMWFEGGVSQTQGFIGRITPTGQVTKFLLPHAGDYPYPAMVVGPDGNVWFVIWGIIKYNGQQLPTSYIGRITPHGTLTRFNPPSCNPRDPVNQHVFFGLTTGPDGNIWYDAVVSDPHCDSSEIDEITPKGTFDHVATLEGSGGAGFAPHGLTAGPSHTVWLVETPLASGVPQSTKIVCFGCGSYALIPAEFSMPKPTQSVDRLVAGPDGNMWFTGRNKGDNGGGFVGQITPSGTITIYPLPANITPSEPVLGPDKALWFIDVDVINGSYVGKELGRFQI